jgi:hypothetical protein
MAVARGGLGKIERKRVVEIGQGLRDPGFQHVKRDNDGRVLLRKEDIR